MGNEETRDPDGPDMDTTADDRMEDVPVAQRRLLAPDDEDDAEAGYGYGV